MFTQHTGRVVDDIDDACFAVFEGPERAIQAALASQRAVASEAWPGEASVKILVSEATATSGAASARLAESGQHDLQDVGRRRLFVVR